MNEEIKVLLVLKPFPPTQGRDNMPVVLSEKSRGYFPLFFLEIYIDQYSVIKFSVFL